MWSIATNILRTKRGRLATLKKNVAGLAAAFGAVLLLGDQDAERTQDEVRLAQLDAQIQRLERSLSRLSSLVTVSQSIPAESSERARAAVVTAPEMARGDDAELRAIAAADELVDQALQTGQWMKRQAAELAEEILAASAAQGGPWATVRTMAAIDYPTLATRPANSVLDCSKARDTLGIALPEWRASVRALVPRMLDT